MGAKDRKEAASKAFDAFVAPQRDHLSRFLWRLPDYWAVENTKQIEQRHCEDSLMISLKRRGKTSAEIADAIEDARIEKYRQRLKKDKKAPLAIEEALKRRVSTKLTEDALRVRLSEYRRLHGLGK